MEENKEHQPGLNILCIDGGGVRGLSALLLLSETMRRLAGMEQDGEKLDPIHYFDVIAGTGTGGISACMLGRLGMSIEQAITAYLKLAKGVFPDRKVVGTKYKQTNLIEALKSMLRDANKSKDERMKTQESGTNRCKTMVFAMSKQNMNAGIPTIFRSYESPANPAPDCTIWEALYATMAHPDLFKSIDINDGPIQHSFVGGELGCSNPISHVLTEVKSMYPTRHVACILSVGAGHTRTIQVPSGSLYHRVLGIQDVIRAMRDMAIDSERVTEEMSTRFQHTSGVYYRLNVDQGVEDTGDDWEKQKEVMAHTKTYLGKVETGRTLAQVTQAVKERRPVISVTHIDGSIGANSSEQAVILKRCPAPTSVFTGRDNLIQQAKSCITGGIDERRVCVMYGLGGAGKTQLALKTIELNRDSWKHVLYVDASSREAIESTLKSFAMAKKIGNSYHSAIQWLETCLEPWLVVFDNADHPSLNIHEYFPNNNRGSILITTRLPDLSAHARGPASVCHVSRMTHEDGLALFLKVARISGKDLAENEIEAAQALLKDFGYLALAIVHAGAYIAHLPHVSISQYRKQFIAQHQQMLDQYNKLKLKLDTYGKSVYTTWTMCYDLLEPNGNAQRLLWLISYLHYDGISEEIFRRAATNIKSYMPGLKQTEAEKDALDYMRNYLGNFLGSDECWDTVRFSDAIGDLAAYSLIDFDRANISYSIHVLVQDWARTVIGLERDFVQECTTVLLSQSVRQDNTLETHTFNRNLILHADTIRKERSCMMGGNHAAGFAEVYRVNGLWNQQEALEIFQKETCEKELGDEHPDTLRSMGNLASTYRNQGRWEEAESLDVQVVNAFKRVLGNEHPDTLRSMGNLASTYGRQGRWDEAESLEVQVMDGFKRVLGNEHPHTLSSMANLAYTHRDQGRWDEAESLLVQVMNARKRVLGDEHPNTLRSMANLAAIYRNKCRWEEAESLDVQVMSAFKRVLGNEHPDTLTTMANLASTYSSQGRSDKAESLLVQVINASKRVLGDEHPSTLRSMGDLASTYLNQGRWDEAESLQVQVMNATKRVLGDEHPATLTNMDNLASTYQDQGRWDEAESLQVQVSNAFKRVLGNEHPDTLTSMSNLASTYSNQGRWDEAESLQVQVINASKRVLGNEHPSTLASMASLASTYWNQARWDEAEQLLATVVDARGRNLGEQHPATLHVRRALDSLRSRPATTPNTTRA